MACISWRKPGDAEESANALCSALPLLTVKTDPLGGNRNPALLVLGCS